MMMHLLGILFLLVSSSCAYFGISNSTSEAPKTVFSVKVSREDAKESCEAMGAVRGTYLGLKPNMRKALEDMRQKAFDKGANYVRLDSSTEAGTTVQGMSFKCP